MKARDYKAKIDQLAPNERDVVFEQCEKTTLKEGVRWLKEEFKITISEARLGRWLERGRRQSPPSLAQEGVKVLLPNSVTRLRIEGYTSEQRPSFQFEITPTAHGMASMTIAIERAAKAPNEDKKPAGAALAAS